ncbi:extracellular solute-binding protein [Candidatus Aerophobetes bacterium]|nr:extracellular solute-binding protein [Candidatus Aerophobetes bacterium]
MLSKKLTGYLAALAGVLLIMLIAGGFALAAEKEELTPLEWSQLKWQDRLKEKKIVIRVKRFGGREWMEDKSLPSDVRNLRERIHTGDVNTFWECYNISLFETAYPEVYVKYVSYNPWSREATANLMAKMAAGNAPCAYCILIPGEAMGAGLCADITDLVTEEWQNLHLKKELIPFFKEYYWLGGRCYGIPLTALKIANLCYRKDYFKEAGIFNKKGEPGPPENWTWQDFRIIAKKLSDPKKQRWGAAYNTKDTVMSNYDYITLYAVTHGWPISGVDRIVPWVLPDKTGKYTYKFDYIKPIAEAVKFFNEMRWEDNSLLVGRDVGSEFDAGRSATKFGGWVTDHFFNDCIFKPHKYSPVKETKDILGIVSPPTSEYGIQPNGCYADPVMFDATLDKEHLKAAFNWATWGLYGIGFQSLAIRDSQLQSVGVTNIGGYTLFKCLSSPYNLEVPYITTKVIDNIRKNFPEVMKRFEEMVKKGTSLPVFLSPKDYGLDFKNISAVHEEENMLRSYLLTKKNISMDAIKEEMEKAADKINRKMLNYKVKGDREKWEAYFKAMDKFYKENYPKFYGTKDYEENFLNYFKF